MRPPILSRPAALLGARSHALTALAPAVSAHARRYKTQNIPYRADEPLPSRRSEPLRILFCGADAFSCASLSALHALHRADPAVVESIDVLVRPGKPSGRGMRRVAVGPLFHLATSLGLPVHQRDTFTGWDLPLPGRVAHPATGAVTVHPHPSGRHPHRPHDPFNLLVAVSFGLFVPPRVLSQLAYGGLNLHPSLLPDLRGPAPLQYTIIAGRPVTGVTLQTMHPKSFDRGEILAQTPAPGIPVGPGCTTADLVAALAPEGARLLVDALRRELHLGPPYAPVPDRLPAPAEPLHAPKVTKADLAIDWGRRVWTRDHRAGLDPAAAGGPWTATDLERRFRALASSFPPALPDGEPKPGPGLWTYALPIKNPCERRIIFSDIEAVECPELLRDAVLAIVQAKKAPLEAPEGLEQALEEASKDASEVTETLPAKVANVVWVGRSVKDNVCYEFIQYRLPLLVERKEGSVVIPVRVPCKLVNGVATAVLEEGEGGPFLDAVRVKSVKLEGSTDKPAANTLRPFMEKRLTFKETAHLDYAMDIMVNMIE